MYSVNFITELYFIIMQGSNYIFPNKCGQFSWFVPDVSILFPKILKLLQCERGAINLNKCNKENRMRKTVSIQCSRADIKTLTFAFPDFLHFNRVTICVYECRVSFIYFCI